MRAVLSLIWKEYREQRWFFIAALALFLGFPLIEATANYVQPAAQYTAAGRIPGEAQFYSDSAGGMVVGLGGLLAIFVAIGSTTRDLRDELHVFWRSRPVSPGLWLAIKYIVGLALVLIACTLPMVMQFVMAAETGRFWSVAEVGHVVGIHSFTLVLVFSVAFLLGCLLRHATHAALLALAAGLVIYFLPVVASPLAPLSVFNLIENDALLVERNITKNPAGWDFYLPYFTKFRVLIEPTEWTTFVAAMLGGSIVAALGAFVAVRRDWRLAVDRQTMHWSLGGVALLLFGATAFQVGSNLKVKQEYELPGPNLNIGNLAFDGQRGVALMWPRMPRQWLEHVNVTVCSVEMTPQGLTYGKPIHLKKTINVPVAWERDALFWRPEHPGRAYLLAQHTDGEIRNGEHYGTVQFRTLLTLDLTGTAPNPIVHRLDINPLIPLQTEVNGCLIGDRIFIDGDDRTLEISLADPDGPTVRQVLHDASPNPFVRGSGGAIWARRQVFPSFLQLHEQTDAAGRVTAEFLLPPVGNLTPRQRLDGMMNMSQMNDRITLAGDLLFSADEEAISTYRLASINADKAVFELIGRCAFLPLERLMGSYVTNMTVIGNHLYARKNGLTVYDISDPANMRRVGHFAQPNSSGSRVAGLPGGDVLVASDKAYILAPPAVLE